MNADATLETQLDTQLALALKAHQAGHLEEAEDLYVAILQAQPYHAIANHNMGLLAGQVGQFRAGLPYLRKALSVNPDEGQFWLSLADGLLKAGERDEALDIIDTAIGRGLDNDQAQTLRARIATAIAAAPTADECQHVVALYQAARYVEMETATRALIARYPTSDFAWSVLGTVLQAQGKDALDALQTTVQLTPYDAEAHCNLANAWQARGEHAQAVQSYQQALQFNPAFAEAHSNLGGALLALGALAEAEDAYLQAIALRPDYGMAHFNLGNTRKARGDLDGAVGAYNAALASMPGDAEVLCNLGNALQALERNEEAADSYRRALALEPRLVMAHSNLGAALQNLEQYAQSEASYRTALSLAPRHADLWNGLGNSLQSQQRLDDAADAYRQALAVQPDYSQAHSNLGGVLVSLGEFDAAIASYRRALELQPDSADAHTQLGLGLQSVGELDEALALHQRAVQLAPDKLQAHTCLGHCLKQMRRFEEAQVAYRQALALAPDVANLHNDLAIAVQDAGDYPQAIRIYQHALELDPRSSLIHCNLSVAFEDSGQSEQALEYLQRARDIAPDSSRVHFTMGNCLRSLKRYDEALASYARSLEIQDDFIGSHLNTCATYSEMGRTDDAVQACRTALARYPQYDEVYSNMLFGLSHMHADDPAAMVAEHFGFGERYETPLRAAWQPHANERDPQRQLKIGLVSGDFCNHAVAHFITPLLEELVAMPQFSLYAYYNNSRVDNVTMRIAQLLPNWLPVTHLSQEKLAERIRADGIDILIDLSGHTAKNCLLAFARKPAPIQMSWIGYPLTTGLQAMDYYLSDRHFSPPETFASHFTEKLIFLPTIAPFLPSENADGILPAPVLKNKYLTFGSFNRPNKLNRQTIARWARVLRAIPDARMLLAAMPAPGPHPGLTAWFAEEGISADRLIFEPRANMASFLAMHHRVDMCLDTAPYGGGTTTFHGLWMGVPTLTVAGPTVPSRAGTSILRHVQLEEFIARDDEEFVSKALYMAANPMLLGAYRFSTRHRLAQTALGQPKLIAEGLANSLRLAWQRWCEDLPPVSFDAPLDSQLPGEIAA
ncbi:TPR repeat-containing protein YrrB [Janthinobacterium sp. HH103]|uniref:tetratricopeptide repeat protein n=1 Tax=unclassified Janthinobacterium TaxID=2610881 RepID=UPI000874A30D|nr:MULTISPECIES: tetratricopeptide repeat protein [unclassified Janthinobacterium]OEZ65862.1 TPR repeat-containing protein YrrB [Janthinobacterium sp. HH100]OEZ74896.1 TPR repeat-containing protein YrrB [Janthinobacterium sp. HH103]QOU73278.1 Photosystem I assembly protein Ycf3 [Janthinobacterium sp. HH102]